MGGMVPTVLVDNATLPHGIDGHVGTMDVDLGLVLAHQSLDKLEKTKARLSEIGFATHPSEQARMRHKDAEGNVVVVDLLCGGESPTNEPSLVLPRIADHVELAFLDSMNVELNGPATDGTEVATSMNACGPGAFVLSKASAFAHRRENKDAYDLFFVLQYFASGPTSVFSTTFAMRRGSKSRRWRRAPFGAFVPFGNPRERCLQHARGKHIGRSEGGHARRRSDTLFEHAAVTDFQWQSLNILDRSWSTDPSN